MDFGSEVAGIAGGPPAIDGAVTATARGTAMIFGPRRSTGAGATDGRAALALARVFAELLFFFSTFVVRGLETRVAFLVADRFARLGGEVLRFFVFFFAFARGPFARAFVRGFLALAGTTFRRFAFRLDPPPLATERFFFARRLLPKSLSPIP